MSHTQKEKSKTERKAMKLPREKEDKNLLRKSKLQGYEHRCP